ncbi:MAG: hypothetical protein Q7W16_09625 [Coriobacteriia bacterium]|nr:hypothetical protein [Coriobacteriia bacterium]
MNSMDVFRFLLALALTPVVWGIARRIRMPRAATPFLIGFIAIVVSLGVATAQPLWDTGIVRAARHFSFAIGGFGLAWAAWEARRNVLESTGERR